MRACTMRVLLADKGGRGRGRDGVEFDEEEAGPGTEEMEEPEYQEVRSKWGAGWGVGQLRMRACAGKEWAWSHG